MDRRRAPSPVYSGKWTTSTGDSMSPSHPHFRQPSVRAAGKTNQNAAGLRLAKVMASQAAAAATDDNGDEDGVGFRFASPPPAPPSHRLSKDDRNHDSYLLHSYLPNRAPTPLTGRNFGDNHAVSVRSTSTARALMPPTNNSIKTYNVTPSIQLPYIKLRDQRVAPVLGQFNFKEQDDQHDAFAVYDELDMLQEENQRILEILRHVQGKHEEAEARVRELEKQVASLGEGVSLEAKLLTRKEEALRRRELALKSEKQKRDSKDLEIVTLQTQLENLKKEVGRKRDHLQEAESETRAFCIMTHRMILTKEEMEEVVLKRCWLARYWGLAVEYGICADISVSKYEFWSAFAPLPFEVVVSAGQKAKDDFLGGNSPAKHNKSTRDQTGEGNIESMLSVEMGLRELASLKIEDAVMLAMAQHRRSYLFRDPKSPADPNFMEAFELNEEESEDVVFKQAWLTYFWNRARNHSVEVDIAEERVQSWVSRSGQSPTSHDAVDVERGLIELKKLGIEQQLWQASRKEIEHLPFAINGKDHKQSPDLPLATNGDNQEQSSSDVPLIANGNNQEESSDPPLITNGNPDQSSEQETC